jgi:hypothetical protein
MPLPPGSSKSGQCRGSQAFPSQYMKKLAWELEHPGLMYPKPWRGNTPQKTFKCLIFEA